MICERCLSGISVTLMLLLVAMPARSEEATPPMTFTYSDNWSKVSAPPPSGPYRSIHIDPRVPGQGSLPPLPGAVQPPQTWEEVQAETESSPPGAGTPAVVVQDEPLQQLRAPEVRSYGRMRPRQPAYSYPDRGGYPDHGYYPNRPQRPDYRDYRSRPPADYQDYRSRPPAGYYGAPARRQEQEVPPPPVYDAMMERYGTSR